jgi:hypothetical protein
MNQHIGVSELKEIKVLYQGDIYELACFILKMDEALDKETNSKSYHTYHTVNGLFRDFAMLAHLEYSQVIAVAVKHGLPLGATVEHDGSEYLLSSQ